MIAQDRAALLMVKGAVSDLTPEQQLKVADVASKLRALIKGAGDEGQVALALVGAELAAEDD